VSQATAAASGTVQKRTDDASPQPSEGKSAVAISPPDYGIDSVDSVKDLPGQGEEWLDRDPDDDAEDSETLQGKFVAAGADPADPGAGAAANVTGMPASLKSVIQDGITHRLGGFKKFDHGEDIDPAGNKGGDYRRGPAAHREGAIFELRNIIPSDAFQVLHGLASDRFPRGHWVTLATYFCDALAALNARTVAQSARDTRFRQATGATQDEAGNW
jgi:hypothetical protein